MIKIILERTLHDKSDFTSGLSTTGVEKEVQNQIMPYHYLDRTDMHAAFGHLKGYSVSYYGYLLSKM